MGESYSCASGGVIAAGLTRINNLAALMGDSLTADSYGLTTYNVINAANGGKMKLMANSAVAGEGIASMLSRINNSYLNASPGFAGLPLLGRIFIRAGTNDARSNVAIGSISSTYTSLLQACAGYARKVIILAVPPLANTTNNAAATSYNAWLAAYAAANPNQFQFIDDCVNVRNGDGSIKSAYFDVDGVHFLHVGTGMIGAVAASALATQLNSYASPLSKDPADIYPEQPQWYANPTNVGTGGTKTAAFTGTVVNSLEVGPYGSGMVGVCSVVAADVGDANQAPWQRVALTSGIAGSGLQLRSPLVGRAINSTDPAQLEVLVECRLTSIDRTKISLLSTEIQANTGEYLSPPTLIDLTDSGSDSGIYVLRTNRNRNGATVPTSVNFYFKAICRAAFGPSANIGSIDVRCITIRG